MFVEIASTLSVSESIRIGLKELPLLEYSRSIQRYAKRYWVKEFGVENILHHIW